MNQKQWWHNIGSAFVPRKEDDMEAHAERIAREAWNSAIDECLDVVDSSVSKSFVGIAIKIKELKR